MLYLDKYDTDNNYRILNLDDRTDFFHRALRLVLGGEKRFHVKNQYGENFDLVYRDNASIGFDNEKLANGPYDQQDMLIPSYMLYDENDTEKILFDIFEGVDNIYFDSVNEYSVTIARVLLKNTDVNIYFNDESVYFFIRKNNRLFISDSIMTNQTGGFIHATDEYVPISFCDSTFKKRWIIGLFHDMFILQWMTDRPLSEIKYVELVLPRIEGIGSILMATSRLSNFVKRFGWKLFITRESTRYKDDMLNKYFRILDMPKDITESNTIFLKGFFTTHHTYPTYNTKVTLGKDIFSEKFLAELEEYRGYAIGDKRTLGVLIRSTDYTLTMPGKRYTLDKLIPIIKADLERNGFEQIFLATEDQDILDKMRDAFPGKVYAVAQERYRMSDFSKHSVISDLDKDKKSGAELDAYLEDTTINYFYAIYILSKCQGFIGNPKTNGTDMVESMNNGEFEMCKILTSWG